ncbi:MAG: phosphate-starvation-inducible PsiE family protein [Cellvibrionales bacterium]|jgi:protein PsiE
MTDPEQEQQQERFLARFDRVVLDLFSVGERLVLVLIGVLAMVAVAIELIDFSREGRVDLADLLLLFIYLEVVGMACAYYATHSVPVTLPVLIAITGITRLIILQGKEFEPTQLVFEAGAVLLLATGYGVLSWASERFRTGKKGVGSRAQPIE